MPARSASENRARPAQVAKRPALPLSVFVLASGTFLMGTTEFVVAGMLPDIAAGFDTTQARAGLAITVFAVGMIIGAPLMPMLTLRLPRRATMVLALVVFAAAHLCSATTDSFAVMLVSRFVSAIATGTFWAIAAVVAADIVGPQRRSSALGIVLGGGMLATVLGVPAGAFAGQLVGWRAPFWALAALAAAVAVAVRRFVPSGAGAPVNTSMRSELSTLRSRRLWLILAACACGNAGVLSIYSFVAPLLVDRAAVAVSVVPVALLLFGAAALVGNVVGGRMGDSWPVGTPVVTMSATWACAVLLCLASTVAAPTLVVFSLLGLVGMSSNPVLVSLAVADGGPGAILPSAMATSSFNLGTAVGTGLTGALLGTSLGTLSPPVVAVVFATLVFAPLGLLARRHRRGGDAAR